MSVRLKKEEVEVLEAVRHEARLSIRDLATRVGLAETTARDILHRLERQGVLRGYRAMVHAGSLGANVRTWLVLRLPDEADEELVEKITLDPGVEQAHLLPDRPGCLAVWAAAPDGNALAVKLSGWASQYGVQVEESHNLCELDEPTRQSLRDEAPDAWFTILKNEVAAP